MRSFIRSSSTQRRTWVSGRAVAVAVIPVAAEAIRGAVEVIPAAIIPTAATIPLAVRAEAFGVTSSVGFLVAAAAIPVVAADVAVAVGPVAEAQATAVTNMNAAIDILTISRASPARDSTMPSKQI